MTLCSSFDPREQPAPQIVQMCAKALEAHARANDKLDLYKLYRATPKSDAMVTTLVNLFNEGNFPKNA